MEEEEENKKKEEKDIPVVAVSNIEGSKKEENVDQDNKAEVK